MTEKRIEAIEQIHIFGIFRKWNKNTEKYWQESGEEKNMYVFDKTIVNIVNTRLAREGGGKKKIKIIFYVMKYLA